MELKTVLSWSVERRIAVVSLCDPETQNALSGRTAEELERALSTLGEDPAVHVIVLQGLPDVFCSGASPEVLRALATGRSAAAAFDFRLPKRVLDVPIPVVAAMAGHAFGAGFVLGMCADIVVMARESRYGLSFMEYGITPGMGATRLLEHVLSPAVAHELLLTAENVRGAELEGRSGINYILAREEVESKARELAARIARKPRLALELLKRALSAPRRQCFESAYTVETLMHDVILHDAGTAGRMNDELSRRAAARGGKT